MRHLLKVIFITVATFYSQSSFAAQVRAQKLSEPISVDGFLNEFFYRTVSPVSNFIQKEPNQGEVPTENDSNPDSIMRILNRRDNFGNSDWFTLFLDPYNDNRSGNYFMIGPAGTINDGVLYNDDWDDSDWDGVWEAKTTIDNEGWTFEMRIPFSQLRFHDKEQQVWGVNLKREIGRKNEFDYLVYTPRMESGFVSRFVDLAGIDGIRSRQSVEVLPFATTKAEYTHPSPGNPFNNGSRYTPDFGADVRYGLNSNLILNATVNPDFGQVEVDPAVVNLSDVESFFNEKRPFFVEGANIFTNYGQGGGRNFWNFNFPYTTPFYSRRIGRSPHGNDTLGGTDFIDMPFATRILGAGKITGKVADSWNVGTIHAVTAREFADYKTGGIRNQAEVEPMTYYGVGRLQRDYNDGRQGIGILGTHTQRRFS
ncbi:MAG: carbohydrate binding family 9 domain-containing protein, partial [Ignavibacteriales bacterium]|nr:carbohydrate binding family 9 domain-containing protein [Ignavibacteriales bacterium]